MRRNATGGVNAGRIELIWLELLSVELQLVEFLWVFVLSSG